MEFIARASAEDRAAADVVRSSPEFDANFYLSQVQEAAAAADPALHYVMVGEAQGAAASPGFSSRVYVALNPDLASAPMNLLAHYEAHGRGEGRARAYKSEHVGLDYFKLDPGKPLVVLLIHEASYSGAPILGWNLARELKLTRNVVIVVQKSGALLPALAEAATALVGPLAPEILASPGELNRLAERIADFYKPAYVIANSIETRSMATALRTKGVPYVALVHEFATHAPPYALKGFYERCAALVFPSNLVRRSSLEGYGLIAQRRTHILPQGPSEIPRLPKPSEGQLATRNGDEAAPGIDLGALLAAPDAPFTVIGLGAVDLRKGVDLFIAAATAAKARHPDVPMRFIWLGERVHGPGHQYNIFLDEQIARSDLKETLYVFPHTDDLEPLYAAADALFISSRLDPLPNVGIDAAVRGIPIACFTEATGFAELLRADPATADLSVPHLEAAAAADALAALARNPARAEAARTAMRRMARRTFDMGRYADRLDRLGLEAAARMADIDREVEVLAPEEAFDAKLYFGPERSPPPQRKQAVRTYLDETREAVWSGPAVWGSHPRRPLPGFHSLIYGQAHLGDRLADDALVDFVRRGKPAGPWAHEVIRIHEGQAAAPSSGLRVGLHGHFHYTDNIQDMLSAIAANATPMDLLLTTTTEASADLLRQAATQFRLGRVEILVGPNVGRDVGPFINILEDRLAGYDVVGHLHGKRSVHTLHYDADLGNRWRRFLWQHLLGPAAPVADIVIRRFAEDSTLGLVFPENDFLVGWEKNREVALELAPRLGLAALPDHIEFPVGTMFWARPQALQALVGARFKAKDYPAEPLPIDGTMLHALERMIPLVAEAAGYHFATTYFPAFTR